MLDRIIKHTAILEKGLDASWKRNEVIAANIANADTPGYKSKNLAFESVFQRELKPDSFALRSGSAGTDNPRHIDFETESSQLRVTEQNRSAMRMDGNNVDVDKEMTELAKNQILFDTLTYTMSKQLGRIKTAINEGK